MHNSKWLATAAGAAIAVLLGAPRVAQAYKTWQYNQNQELLAAAQAAIAAGADGLPDLSALSDTDAKASDQTDDATVRNLVMAAEIGPRPQWAMQQLLSTIAEERAKWADPTVAAAAGATTPGTRAWSNIGPLSARSEFNGTYYKGMDTGRPNTIAMDPIDPNSIYVAFSGGGVWHAPDFGGNYPTWAPITETLGQLAIGAMAISPLIGLSGERTLWLGLGDFVDQKVGLLVKGTYTPSSKVSAWGAPIALGAAAHPVDGLPVQVQDVRDIKVDPRDSNHILVATNDGLYISIDGANFNLVDLPNALAPGATTSPNVRESTWSIAYGGVDPGTLANVWLVSGVYGCPTLPGATQAAFPPLAGGGSMSCPAPGGGIDTTHWNMGDIWRSTDNGATWISMRAAFSAPSQVFSSRGNDPGRIALAAGAPTVVGPNLRTVIYAQMGNAQESNSPGGCTPHLPVPTGGTLCTVVHGTAWYLKSIDGGNSWGIIATGLNDNRASVASPTLVTNPSTQARDAQLVAGGQGCETVDTAHGQAWYNLSAVVDPQNPNRALFGGNLCSIRTTDGGNSWASASNWLPQSGLGLTQFGFLPYVHADWHTSIAVVQPNGQTMVLAGTDGGLFVSRNIWDVATPELAQWQQPDVGITTHLFYGVSTGDPALGNPNIVYGGLQDNGTRWRLVNDERFIAEFNPGNWDQILGGDGFGSGLAQDTNGQNQVFWISVNGTRRFCLPRLWNCGQATRIENGVESANWRSPGTLGVADPTLIRYDSLGDDSSGIASASNAQANIWFINQTSGLASVRNIVPANGVVADLKVRTIRSMGLRVSPYRYTIDGVANTRIYGGVTTSSVSSTGSFLAFEKPNANGTFTSTVVTNNHGIQVPNVTGKGTGTIWIGFGSDFAAPPVPQALGGTDSKLTWLASSNAVTSNAVDRTANPNGAGCLDPSSPTCDPSVFIPPLVGHVFKTIDGGQTWIPFHGNGTGFDLPNAPVFVMRYDPNDLTGNTLYVGTDFGLYRTTDAGNTWAPFGLGLPAVRVTDIQIVPNGSLVRISTYGRGIWEIYPNSEPPVANGTGDFDKNHVVDFFDMASLAARMGSTPGATNNLVYDSSLDLNGDSTIDEAGDLAPLVAKFGSNP